MLVNALIEQPAKVRPPTIIWSHSMFKYEHCLNNRHLELPNRRIPKSCRPGYLLWASRRRGPKRALLQHTHWSVCREMHGTRKNKRTFRRHRGDHPQTSLNLQRAIYRCSRTVRKVWKSSLSRRQWRPIASVEADSPGHATSSQFPYWNPELRQINSWQQNLWKNKRQADKLQQLCQVKRA